MSKLTFNQRFLAVQLGLQVGKGVHNSFGGFNYRTKPQILEALKPLQEKHNIVIYTTSELVEVAGRVFVKSTAVAHDVEDDTLRKEAHAFAELQAKSGTKMSEPQLTGSSDSYAGKYALGNLFNIDDNTDPDEEQVERVTNVTTKEVEGLSKTTENKAVKDAMLFRGKILQIPLNTLTVAQVNELLDELEKDFDNDAASLKMINTKASAKGFKYNETTKRWEE